MGVLLWGQKKRLAPIGCTAVFLYAVFGKPAVCPQRFPFLSSLVVLLTPTSSFPQRPSRFPNDRLSPWGCPQKLWELRGYSAGWRSSSDSLVHPHPYCMTAPGYGHKASDMNRPFGSGVFCLFRRVCSSSETVPGALAPQAVPTGTPPAERRGFP